MTTMTEHNETLQHHYITQGFSKKMAVALDSHRHLGRWSQWVPDQDEMARRMVSNQTQLLKSLYEGGPSDIIRHAVNLANICMKIVEVYTNTAPPTTRSDDSPQSSKGG